MTEPASTVHTGRADRSQQPTDTPLPAIVARMLATAVWLLPAYGGLLTVGTLTHQPDYTTDFAGYANYVTTPQFLAGHLAASIFGAVLGFISIAAAGLLVAVHGPQPGRALTGAALSFAGNVANVSLFGVAAFTQPAIGRAYQGGLTRAAEDWNSDVYGGPLTGTAIVGLLAFIAGAVLLGGAISRTGRRLRLPGVLYAVSLPVFVVSGLAGLVVQPVAAAVFTLAAFLIARHLTDLTRTSAAVATA